MSVLIPTKEKVNNMIKIRAEKIVKDGIACRKIINISGVLSKEDLPVDYVNGPYFTTLGNSSRPAIDFRNQTDESIESIWVGGTIEENEFQKTLKAIGEYGDRLHEINQKIAELKKTWNGTETFCF